MMKFSQLKLHHCYAVVTLHSPDQAMGHTLVSLIKEPYYIEEIVLCGAASNGFLISAKDGKTDLCLHS